MSVRLLRKSSDTPNITNRDDANMIRYAYGGSDGVVKNFGSELSYIVSGSNFVLTSGKIVVQGWEVIVDSWELNLSTVTGTQYHLVYLEVNAASETAVIKSTYLTNSVPSIEPGDDLTQYLNGTARIPLYSFKISSKSISSVKKEFSVLEYTNPRIDTAEKVLTSLSIWKSNILKDQEIQITNIGTALYVDMGAKNVELVPGKIYVFNCVFEDKANASDATMVMYYSENGTVCYSDTTFNTLGGIKYAIRLAYNGTEKVLRLEGCYNANFVDFWFGSAGYSAILHYREF